MSRYPAQTPASTSPSQAIDDSKRRTSLLKDNSWIKKPEEEDEAVDRDPNFGKYVLGHHKSTETLTSSETDDVKPTKTTTTSTTVQALSKRFSGTLDEPQNSTKSSYTKSTYSSVKSDSSNSTTTTTVTKDGKTTETTITTTQSLRSPGIKSPTKTETFTERVQASSKGYTTYAPTKTSRVTSKSNAEDLLYDTLIPSSIKDDSQTTISTTETVVVRSSPNDAEDKLYDTLLPKGVKEDVTDSKSTLISSEIVTVKRSIDEDDIISTTTRKSSSTPEDDLYDTLLPKSITSGLSSPVSSSSITRREIVTVESTRGGDSPVLTSPSSTRTVSSYSSYSDDIPATQTTSYTISSKPSDDYSSDRKSSYSRSSSGYEYSSITSPSAYSSTSYRRSDDTLSDTISSKSMRSVYASERPVLEKDLCTYCRKPFMGEAKMVLDDMKINCHASCFKCEVCNGTLGHLKAGDSMWIYKHMVHCESCFGITREKWRH